VVASINMNLTESKLIRL